MADVSMAVRAAPLDNDRFANRAVTIETLAPAARASLRGEGDALSVVEAGLGFGLPREPKHSTSNGQRHALWLGPDEWLLIDDGDAEADLLALGGDAEVAVVDVSHRNAGFRVFGPKVETVLQGGCPQNLSLATFPVGACSRTIFGKAEVVLLRTADDTFRVECWRSFAPYVFGLLCETARDAKY